jgi:hypothetical protein
MFQNYCCQINLIIPFAIWPKEKWTWPRFAHYAPMGSSIIYKMIILNPYNVCYQMYKCIAICTIQTQDFNFYNNWVNPNSCLDYCLGRSTLTFAQTYTFEQSIGTLLCTSLCQGLDKLHCWFIIIIIWPLQFFNCHKRLNSTKLNGTN